MGDKRLIEVFGENTLTDDELLEFLQGWDLKVSSKGTHLVPQHNKKSRENMFNRLARAVTTVEADDAEPDLVVAILQMIRVSANAAIQNNQTKQLDAQIDGGLFDHLSVVLRIEHSTNEVTATKILVVELLSDIADMKDEKISRHIVKGTFQSVLAILTNTSSVSSTLQLRRLCLELIKTLNTQFNEADGDGSVADSAFSDPDMMHDAAINVLKCIGPTGDFLAQMDLVELLISGILVLDSNESKVVLSDLFGEDVGRVFHAIDPGTFETDTTNFLAALNKMDGAVIIAPVRTVFLDEIEAQPPSEFTEAEVSNCVCFNTSSDSIVFPVQYEEDLDATYQWAELDNACVKSASLSSDGRTITLEIVDGFDPDKVSLPEGTNMVIIDLVEAIEELPVFRDVAARRKIVVTTHVSTPVAVPLHKPQSKADLGETYDSFDEVDDPMAANERGRYTPLQFRVNTPLSVGRARSLLPIPQEDSQEFLPSPETHNLTTTEAVQSTFQDDAEVDDFNTSLRKEEMVFSSQSMKGSSSDEDWGPSSDRTSKSESKSNRKSKQAKVQVPKKKSAEPRNKQRKSAAKSNQVADSFEFNSDTGTLRPELDKPIVDAETDWSVDNEAKATPALNFEGSDGTSVFEEDVEGEPLREEPSVPAPVRDVKPNWSSKPRTRAVKATQAKRDPEGSGRSDSDDNEPPCKPSPESVLEVTKPAKKTRSSKKASSAVKIKNKKQAKNATKNHKKKANPPQISLPSTEKSKRKSSRLLLSPPPTTEKATAEHRVKAVKQATTKSKGQSSKVMSNPSLSPESSFNLSLNLSCDDDICDDSEQSDDGDYDEDILIDEALRQSAKSILVSPRGVKPWRGGIGSTTRLMELEATHRDDIASVSSSVSPVKSKRSTTKRRAHEVSNNDEFRHLDRWQTAEGAQAKSNKKPKVDQEATVKNVFAAAAIDMHTQIMSIHNTQQAEFDEVYVRHNAEKAMLFKKLATINKRLKKVTVENNRLIRGLEDNTATQVALEQWIHEQFPFADEVDVAAQVDLTTSDVERIETCATKLSERVKKALGALQADSKSKQKMNMMRMMASMIE